MPPRTEGLRGYGLSKLDAHAGGNLGLVGESVEAAELVPAAQLRVIRGQIDLGAPIEVIEDRAVQRFLVARDGSPRVAGIRVGREDVSGSVHPGVIRVQGLVAELEVHRTRRRDLRRDGPRMVLALAEGSRLVGVVLVVTGVDA